MCFSPRIETHLPDTSLLVVLLLLILFDFKPIWLILQNYRTHTRV